MPRRYVPQHGDLVWLHFNPQAGHEQAGRRPAIVLSPREYNEKVGLALFCPVTNQVKEYPFEVVLPKGLKATGAILSDQLKSLDWKEHKIKRICKAPQVVIDEVIGKVTLLLS
jgi:mRNA interferase MazF